MKIYRFSKPHLGALRIFHTAAVFSTRCKPLKTHANESSFESKSARYKYSVTGDGWLYTSDHQTRARRTWSPAF